jgi:anti-sigma factor RsiW
MSIGFHWADQTDPPIALVQLMDQPNQEAVTEQQRREVRREKISRAFCPDFFWTLPRKSRATLVWLLCPLFVVLQYHMRIKGICDEQ